MEASLTTFQKDLGVVSAEIETLQSRSTALNTKLENRKVVEQLLGPAVEDISIAPDVVKIISEGPIDQKWVKALEELERRSNAIKDRMKGPDTVRAISNLQPLLNDLSNKVCSRVYLPLIEIALIFLRLLNESGIILLLKLKPCDHQMSTLKLYSNRGSLIIKLSSLSWQLIILSWQMRLVKRT